MKIGVFVGCECQPLFDYLQTKNIEGIEWLSVDVKTWRESSCDAYMLSQKEAAHLLSLMPRLPSEVRSTGACDILLKENGEYWPHNNLGSILSEILIARCPHLDTQAIAYVTGDGPWPRTLISVLIQMGFAKINWIPLNRQDAEVVANEIRGSFFGTQLRILDSADLNQQPSNGSLLINTLSVAEHPEALADLTYLNFIQKSGLVADLLVLPLEKDILNEARNVGISVLNGSEVAWDWWHFFCEKNKLGGMRDLAFEDFDSYLKTRPKPS